MFRQQENLLCMYLQWRFIYPDTFVPGRSFRINEFSGLLNHPLVRTWKLVPSLFVRTSEISGLSEFGLTNHHCTIYPKTKKVLGYTSFIISVYLPIHPPVLLTYSDDTSEENLLIVYGCKIRDQGETLGLHTNAFPHYKSNIFWSTGIMTVLHK